MLSNYFTNANISLITLTCINTSTIESYFDFLKIDKYSNIFQAEINVSNVIAFLNQFDHAHTYIYEGQSLHFFLDLLDYFFYYHLIIKANHGHFDEEIIAQTYYRESIKMCNEHFPGLNSHFSFFQTGCKPRQSVSNLFGFLTSTILGNIFQNFDRFFFYRQLISLNTMLKYTTMLFIYLEYGIKELMNQVCRLSNNRDSE